MSGVARSKFVKLLIKKSSITVNLIVIMTVCLIQKKISNLHSSDIHVHGLLIFMQMTALICTRAHKFESTFILHKHKLEMNMYKVVPIVSV